MKTSLSHLQSFLQLHGNAEGTSNKVGTTMLGHLQCPPHPVHVCLALRREPLEPGEERSAHSGLVRIRRKPATTFTCIALCQESRALHKPFLKLCLPCSMAPATTEPNLNFVIFSTCKSNLLEKYKLKVVFLSATCIFNLL